MPVGEFVVEWVVEQVDPLLSHRVPDPMNGQTPDCPRPGKQRFPPHLRLDLTMTHPQTAGLAEDVNWTTLVLDPAHRLLCCSSRACKVNNLEIYKEKVNLHAFQTLFLNGLIKIRQVPRISHRQYGQVGVML